MPNNSGPMACPVDGATLVMSERSGIEIDYCPTCRGVWLDRGELDKIIERNSVQTPAAPAAPPAPRPPPPAGAPGMRSSASPPARGGGLDRGELDKIIERNSVQPPAAPEAPQAPQPP